MAKEEVFDTYADCNELGYLTSTSMSSGGR